MSLFSTLFGGGSNGNINDGVNFLKQSGGTAASAYNQLAQNYSDNLAKGAYSPEQAYKLAADRANEGLRLDTGNTIQYLASLGYKPGDSNIEQKPRQLSENYNLGLRGQMLDLANSFRSQQQQDLNNLSSAGMGLANTQQNLGNNLFQIGQQQQQQQGGLFNTLGQLYGMSKGFGGNRAQVSSQQPAPAPQGQMTPNYGFNDANSTSRMDGTFGLNPNFSYMQNLIKSIKPGLFGRF